MKKQYENPIISIEEFDSENILTASGNYDPAGILDVDNPINWFN